MCTTCGDKHFVQVITVITFLWQHYLVQNIKSKCILIPQYSQFCIQSNAPSRCYIHLKETVYYMSHKKTNIYVAYPVLKNMCCSFLLPPFSGQILIYYVFIFQVYDGAVTKWRELETPYTAMCVGISATVHFFFTYKAIEFNNIVAFFLPPST